MGKIGLKFDNNSNFIFSFRNITILHNISYNYLNSNYLCLWIFYQWKKTNQSTICFQKVWLKLFHSLSRSWEILRCAKQSSKPRFRSRSKSSSLSIKPAWLPLLLWIRMKIKLSKPSRRILSTTLTRWLLTKLFKCTTLWTDRSHLESALELALTRLWSAVNPRWALWPKK